MRVVGVGCACACMHVCIRVCGFALCIWTCFVVVVKLEYEMCTPMAHLRKGAPRPHFFSLGSEEKMDWGWGGGGGVKLSGQEGLWLDLCTLVCRCTRSLAPVPCSLAWTSS